jgi:hypothetical protein
MGASQNPETVKASRDQVSGAGPVSFFVSKGERTVNSEVFAVPDKIFAVSDREVDFRYISPLARLSRVVPGQIPD